MIARALAGEQEELVGDEGLDWEPEKVEDGQGGHAGVCLGLRWKPQRGSRCSSPGRRF